MKRIAWIAYLTLAGIAAVLVVQAPVLGLGSRYDFVLYRWIGLSRGTAFSLLFWVTTILLIYEFLGLNIKDAGSRPRIVQIAAAAGRDVAAVFRQWVSGPRAQASRRDRLFVLAVAAAFAVAFALFIDKSLSWYKLAIDQHWWQALIDYGIAWRTPVAGFGGNLLNNFGIELPLKGRLLPIEGLASFAPIEYRIAAATSLYFLFAAMLFWVVGALIGLSVLVRTFFAGFVALLLTVPSGLDWVAWFAPPNFFTHQFTLALWWGEAPLVMLASALCFLVLGRHASLAANAASGVAFAAGVFTIIFSLVTGVVYFVPLLAAYCFGFLITVESRQELIWKLATSAVIGGVLLVAGYPRFISNLYGYSYCSYYRELCDNFVPTFETDFLFATHLSDPRGLAVFVIAFAAIACIAFWGRGPVRRIAIAALICEGAIVIGGTVNRAFFQIPLVASYAELGHAPLWAAFLVLAAMMAFRMFDRRLAALEIPAGSGGARLFPWLGPVIRHRYYGYGLIAFLLMTNFAVRAPKLEHYSDYPPGQPESVALLKSALGISPGSQFRGRMMTLVLIDQPKPLGLYDFYEVIANRYRRFLRNDHFLDVLAFDIPIINEYGYWASPPTFGIFRAFFARPGETFGRVWSLLTQFDLRMARMMGVRMVVTNAAAIPGGTLLLETRTGDTFLRIFRIDDANLGQYSPTLAQPIASATEAIRLMKDARFDPRRDVLVEQEVAAGLRAATSASVQTNLGGTITVRATSPGSSLLALPFEFSHCLTIRPISGAGQIMPVNLQQVGLLFEGSIEAEIGYRFGLFGDSRCRGEDLKRADRLRFKEMVIAHDRGALR